MKMVVSGVPMMVVSGAPVMVMVGSPMISVLRWWWKGNDAVGDFLWLNNKNIR